MNYKISVLVAAYNASKFINQCLDSLVNQTLKDIQIICIDDASTDHTLSVLNEYAERDERILVLKNKKNLGLAKTRNKGLIYATGEFITFLDSDDWFEKDALFKAYEQSLKFPCADAILFKLALYIEKTKETIFFNIQTDKNIFTGNEAMVLSLEKKIHGIYLIRHDIHKKYPYDDTTKLYSDENITYIHFLHSKHVCTCEGIYYYRQHSESNTKLNNIHHFDILEARLNLKNKLLEEKVNEQFISTLENIRWKILIGEYIFYLRNKSNFTKVEQKNILNRIYLNLSTIENYKIDKNLRRKFGYIPFKNPLLLKLEIIIYERLQSFYHHVKAIIRS